MSSTLNEPHPELYSYQAAVDGDYPAASTSGENAGRAMFPLSSSSGRKPRTTPTGSAIRQTWRREVEQRTYVGRRPVTDLVAHPEREPDLGPSREALADGAPPGDALSPHADAEIADAPEPEDELDWAPGTSRGLPAEAGSAIGGALPWLVAREREELEAGQ